MKSTIAILLLSIMTISTQAQINALDRYFEVYQQDTNFTKISITGKMFELITQIETENEEIDQIQDFIKDIESVNILANDKVTDGSVKYQKAVSQVSQHYEELMEIDDKDGKATFYINESNGIIRELVIIGGAHNAFGLISILGNIDLNKLAELSKKLNGKGFEELRKLGDYGMSEISVFPNPAKHGEQISINISDEMEGADVTIFNMSGQAVLKRQNIGLSSRISTAEISTGSYIVSIEKDGVAIHKKLLLK